MPVPVRCLAGGLYGGPYRGGENRPGQQSRLSHSTKGAPLRPLEPCVHPSDHAFIAIEILLPDTLFLFYKISFELMHEVSINTIKPLLIKTV